MTKNNIASGATKVCSKCEVEKELCLFYKDKTHKKILTYRGLFIFCKR